LNKAGANYQYALSSNGRDFFLSSSGRNYGEAFDNFVDLLDEESRDYVGVCEVRETDKGENKGLVVLIGRIISERR